jgi:antitoxin YefM
MMRTANYTDLRKNLRAYLDGVINNSEPLIVSRPSNASVVVIPLDEYNAIKETEYIMSSDQMVKRIKEAQKEMYDGGGKTIHIDDLWK